MPWPTCFDGPALKLHIDFETRSELDLKKVGLHRYARHPSTDIWCLAVAVGDEEPRIILPPGRGGTPGFSFGPLPDAQIYGWNVGFEYEIWNNIMVPRYGWPPLALEQCYCTMSMSFAMAFPGALDAASYAFGIEECKDKLGHAMMLKYAKPWRRDPVQWMTDCPQFTLGGRKWTGAEGLTYLHEYCKQDVRAEREIGHYVLPLSDKERRVWLVDQKINARGVQLDMESVRAAVDMCEAAKARAAEELCRITDGAVQKVSAVAAFKEWTAAQGAEMTSLVKQQVIDLLAADDDEDVSFELPAKVREALIVRQESGKASVAKFDKMLDLAGEDGRLRHVYQYHGAYSGRWAGRKVQTHNLVRDMPPPETVEKILALVRRRQWQAIDMIYGPPLTVLSRCMRSFFVAPEGKKWISGDWSNVEGRGQAWFAGEQWKMDAFVAADEKRGPGLYELAYSRMFHVPVESVKNPSEERQIGKVSELAFGYQGGLGSFRTMAKAYPDMRVQEMSDEQINGYKDSWRDAHPAIAGVRNEHGYRRGGVWYGIQSAAISAIMNPGEKFECGVPGRHATYLMRPDMPHLWCLLPSGRAICYPYSKILEGDFGLQLTYMCQPSQEDRKKKKIIYDDMNGPKWVRVGTYGGSLFNNIVQGFCRDFLADLLLWLDDMGAAIVMHTHDDGNIEVEIAKAEGARQAMQDRMRLVPAWASGFPLFARCSVLDRYGK
jgi:DNA polymerase